MAPPPSKKAKLPNEHDSKVLERTIRQAVLSDDASCEAILGKLVGLEKEIVDAVLVILKSCSVFQFSLTSPVLKLVCQYFAAVGVSTAIERFHEFHDLILSNIDNEFASNFAFLMEKLITCVHVLRHDKLRQEICNHLPDTITLLWKNKKRVEACRIAKCFVHLLIVSKWYRDEDLSKLWLEKTYSTEMKKCPYMSALTVLLDPQVAEGIFELSSLMELPSSEIKELCLRSQAVHLFLTYLPSYYTCCSHKLLRVLIEFIILHYIRADNLSSLVKDIIYATDSIADVDILWGIIFKLLCRHMSKVLAAEDTDKSPIIGALASALQSFSVEEDSGSSFETLPAPVRSFFEQEREQKTRKFELCHDSRCIAGVLCDIPLQTLPPALSKQLAMAMLMLAITLEHVDLTLFSSTIRVLRALTRQAEIRRCLREIFTTNGIFVDHCLFSHEARYPPELCKDLIKFLCNVLEADSTTATHSEDMYDLCPALKYFGDQDAECWSWKQTMRLSILFATTRWEEVSHCADRLQQDILEKIRTTYLISMVSAISHKDKERVEAYADRWSILFTCWEAIPRSTRQSFMTKLLDNGTKRVKKFADSIIKGKFQLDRTIVDQAVIFELKYLTTVDGRHALDEVIDWNVLLSLQRMGASLDIVVAQLSVEKILEMLQSCLLEDLLNEDSLALIERMMSSRLKEHSNDALVCLTSVIEKARLCSQLLKCAATALKVFAQTDIERDVVVLCLSLLSAYEVDGADFHQLTAIQSVLHNAMHYAHSSTNNDQCAVFAQLFVKMIRGVQHLVHRKCGTADEIDVLLHGANRLSHLLAKHKLYYSRVIGSILSQIISRYDSSQVAIFKLHSINDMHSSSMMATSLPPAERLQYKRIFKTVKATMKPIV